MEEKQSDTFCYKCKYAKPIPGDCHIRCDHYLLHNASNKNIVYLSLSTLSPRDISNIKTTAKKLKIKIDIYGFSRGLAMWPFNFDPKWILNCNGREEQ